MRLLHATPRRNLPAIMRDGLGVGMAGNGASNQIAVYLSASDPTGFVAGLYGLPVSEVVLLEVEVDGIPLWSGDDDDPDEYAVLRPIGPERLTVRD